MFLTVISYVIGVSMEIAIPRWGWFRYLNPVCVYDPAFQFINTS